MVSVSNLLTFDKIIFSPLFNTMTILLSICTHIHLFLMTFKILENPIATFFLFTGINWKFHTF